MTGRTSIAFVILPLLLAALAGPATADSSPKTKAKLPAAGQTTLRSSTNLGATGSNADAELQMIQLQSIMSQRQTAIQTTTNTLSSMNDSQKNIINNIGGGCSPNC